MREILISSANNYASGVTTIDNINSLAAGSLCFFEEDGTVISGTLPNPTKDNFFVALGRTTDGTKRSQLINRPTLSWVKTGYTAPVAKVVVVGYDGSVGTVFPALTTSDIGQEVGIIVVDLEKPTYDNTRNMRYTVVIPNASYTIDNLCTALAAKVNADANKIVAATIQNTNDGLIFTGSTAGYNFTVQPFGVTFKDSPVIEYKRVDGVYNGSATTTTALTKGTNTYAQIAAMEDDFATEDGNTARIEFPTKMFTASRLAGTSGGYVTYTLTWQNPNTNMPNAHSTQDIQTLVIAAVSTHATAIAALDAIMATL